MEPTRAAADTRPVTVVVVDDDGDIRELLRLQFERDPRFEVVGEAADGEDAIAVAEALQPDLVVLDRQMPRLGGVEALPEIRRRAPSTAVVLYTAAADAPTYHAALAAGAVDVVPKRATGPDLVQTLVGALLARSASPDADIEVHVGPVSSGAARVWVANTRTILDALEAHPEVLDDPVPADVLALFRAFVRQWAEIAESTDEFQWAARASAADVSRVVEQWAVIDAMSDDQLNRLGVHWAPPEAEPFFSALTAGVLRALERHEETKRLGALLDAQWAAYRRDQRPRGEGASR